MKYHSPAARPGIPGNHNVPPIRPLWPALLALWVALLWPCMLLAAPYELGQGYPIAGPGLIASGYLSLRADNLEGERAKLALQDASLLLHGDPSPVWHFFAEIELSNALVYNHDGLKTTDADLDFERLYLDHNLNSRATLRLGKFLTPIGRWNLIHADPLVWTVSRPLTTAAAFARNAAGAQLLGSWPLDDSAIDFSLYLDDSARLDPSEGQEKTFLDLSLKPNPPSSFRHGGGARLAYRNFDDSLQLGLSAARFTLKDLPGGKNLLGADFFYGRNNLELTGEAVYRHDEQSGGGEEWGAFMQLALPLGAGFYGIAEQEHYKAALFPHPVDSTSLGITWRPTPPFSIKLERRESRGEEQLAPDGWLFSIAILL
jgi:hypothetical protein